MIKKRQTERKRNMQKDKTNKRVRERERQTDRGRHQIPVSQSEVRIICALFYSYAH